MPIYICTKHEHQIHTVKKAFEHNLKTKGEKTTDPARACLLLRSFYAITVHCNKSFCSQVSYSIS